MSPFKNMFVTPVVGVSNCAATLKQKALVVAGKIILPIDFITLNITWAARQISTPYRVLLKVEP